MQLQHFAEKSFAVINNEDHFKFKHISVLCNSDYDSTCEMDNCLADCGVFSRGLSLHCHQTLRRS